jgi:uncharacterized OB-fold protein
MHDSEYFRAWRKRRVASGKCGACGRLRQKLVWLCDACAKAHAFRQRKHRRDRAKENANVD